MGEAAEAARSAAEAPGERVALIGTGYIGSSLVAALRAAGRVRASVGYDAERGVLERARRAGIVEELAASPAEAVRGADVVVLATPVGATAEVAAEVAAELEPGALVFDVGSTKAAVVAAVEEALGARRGSFVGAHPIAGREHRGPEAADPALFRERPCVLTPSARTPAETVERCARLWQAVGARVVRLAPELHDRVLGLVSHLPHVAAFALGATVDAVLGEDAALAAATQGLWGGSFADMTRVTGSSPVMWRDVLLSNRDVVRELVERLIAELGALRDVLAAGDGQAVCGVVERAAAGRLRVMERA